MGAVNCAVSRNGKLIGENTDGKGSCSHCANLSIRRKIRVMFGAGELPAPSAWNWRCGARHITIVNRDQMRANR
jgi:shikimate dehydrogenase